MNSSKRKYKPKRYTSLPEAFVGWMNEREWDIAITFTFAKNTTENQARRLMLLFSNKVDKRIFGSHRKNRIQKAFVVEKGYNNDNVHCHAMIKTPPEANMHPQAFCHFLNAHWNRLRNTKSKRTTYQTLTYPTKQYYNFPNAGIAEFVPLLSEATWSKYISKSITKTNADALDILCTNI